MAGLIKNIYNHESLRKLALDIQSAYSIFQVDEFLKSTMDEMWKDLELKVHFKTLFVQVNLTN